MRGLKRNVLFWLLLATGVCCCIFSLARRAAAEGADRQVAYAVCWSDAQTLSAAAGTDAADWLRTLSGAGVGYLIGTDDTEAEAKTAAASAGMAFARAGDTARTGDAFLLPPLGSDGLIAAYGAPQGDASVPLALVENRSRTGVLMPDGFDPDAWDGPMVKTLYLYPEYADGAGYPSPGASTTENVLDRAVAERGMRLIVLRPFTDAAGETVADPAVYVEKLSTLTDWLAKRGYTAGGTFSCPDAPRLSRVLLAGMTLLPAAALVLFLFVLLPADIEVKPLWAYLLLALGAAAAICGALIAPRLLQTLTAFGTAVLAACWSALWLAYLASDGDSRWTRFAAKTPFPVHCAAALGGLLLPALAGGLCVGALLADRAYLLEFRVFTGVKLAQAAPLVFAAAALIVVLLRRSGRAAAKPRPLSPALIVLCLAAAAAALALVLLRSGDRISLISTLEWRVRDGMERVFYARPRTKEFLMAFPALALFLAAAEKRVRALLLPLGVLAEVGAVSVVNTFCHLFTPLRVSLARMLTGAAIGLVLVLAISALCMYIFARAGRE